MVDCSSSGRLSDRMTLFLERLQPIMANWPPPPTPLKVQTGCNTFFIAKLDELKIYKLLCPLQTRTWALCWSGRGGVSPVKLGGWCCCCCCCCQSTKVGSRGSRAEKWLLCHQCQVFLHFYRTIDFYNRGGMAPSWSMRPWQAWNDC